MCISTFDIMDVEREQVEEGLRKLYQLDVAVDQDMTRRLQDHLDQYCNLEGELDYSLIRTSVILNLGLGDVMIRISRKKLVPEMIDILRWCMECTGTEPYEIQYHLLHSDIYPFSWLFTLLFMRSRSKLPIGYLTSI